jgi:hypothetical protein
VTADVRAGATLPGLDWIAASILGVGVVMLVIGGLLMALAVHSAAQPLYGVPTPGGPPAPDGPPAPTGPPPVEPEPAGTRT